MIKLRVAALALLLPAAALANGYSVPNVNPRDLGLAGSAIASQRDAAAVYANPAALARLDEGFQLALAGSLVDIHQDWHAPVGPASASTNLKLAPPAGAFAAYSTTIAGHRAGFGAGFNVPFGGSVFWDTGWQGNQRIMTVDRKVYGFYANGALQAGPYVRLGGGLLYYYSTEYLKQAINYVSNVGWGEVSTSGGALAFQLSLEIQPTESVRIGVDYKHKATQDLKGDASFHDVPVAIRPNLPDQSVTHNLTIPNVLQAGVAWQATRDLQLNVAYSFDRYHVYREDLFQGSAGTKVFVPRNYGNGYTFRGGVEYRLLKTLELRAGVLRDVSGSDESIYSPSLPDASCWAATVGASWRFVPTMTVDAAFFGALFDRVHDTTSTLGGSYDIRAEVVSLGFTWRPALR